MTQTNDQALLVLGTLRKKNIPARLMQTNKNFRLTDLVEIDFFLRNILKEQKPVKISKETWETAKEVLDRTYSRSTILENCHALLDAFTRVTQSGIYINDFITFLYESHFEDFLTCSDNCVQIGTMHKAKGKEFDSVFIYAPYSHPQLSPEEIRVLYVAATRAKEFLSIHTNVALFEKQQAPNLTYLVSSSSWTHPSEIIIQAWHEDVHLDFFLDPNRQKIYSELQSGDAIEYRNFSCYYKNRQIIRFSNSFKEKLQKIGTLGYSPAGVLVRYMVYWEKQGSSERSLILLPELRFERAPNYIETSKDTSNALLDD